MSQRAPARPLADAAERTAVVTGAASGIGLSIARALADARHPLIAVDRDFSSAGAALLPASAHRLEIDVTDSAVVDDIVGALPEHLAEIEILVNAAGHDPGGTTRYDQGNPDDWHSAIATNLLGTMRMTRAILPGMVQRDSGDIVNVGSVAGIRVVPDMAAYATSKAGIHAFCDSLRADLADTSIRVIEILPGLTRTDLIRKRYRGDEARAAEYYERFGMALLPEDIARTVVHAVSAPRHVVVAQALVLPNNRW